jgi:hypothetical protein
MTGFLSLGSSRKPSNYGRQFNPSAIGPSVSGRSSRDSGDADPLAAIALTLGTTKETLMKFAADGLSMPLGDPYSDFGAIEEGSYASKVVEFIGGLMTTPKIDTLHILSFSKWFATWNKRKMAIIDEYGYTDQTRDVIYAFDLTKLKPESIDPAYKLELGSGIHSVLRAGI